MGFQAGPKTIATKIVSASDSLDRTKADYICDGVSDQTEINSAIAALSASGGVVYLLDGTFIIDGQITIDKSNVTLVGAGAGTVIKIKDSHNADINVISVDTKNNVLIKDLRIDGNKANQSSGTMHGIYFDTVTYSKVEGCWVKDLRTYGISLYTSSNNNTISGNICQGNGSSGIILVTSINNTVNGNTCNGNTLDGIVLVTASNHNTVSGNTCQGNGLRGIDLQPSSDYNTVTGNTCQGNTQHGIYVDTSSHNTITGNTVQGNGQRGIYVDVSSGYNTVSGNTCQGNGLYGIQVQWSNNTVTGNTCQGNGVDGIRLASAGNNTVAGNTCQGNGQHGIDLSTSSNNTIVGNTVVGNSQDTDDTYDGIFVDADSNYNNIQGNTVRHAGGAKQHRYGIRINNANCDGNFIHDNDIYTAGKTANYSDAGTGTTSEKNSCGGNIFNSKGCGFATVQAAIDDQAGGGIVHVPAGTYNEALTITNANLILEGDGRGTIINGGATGHAIYVNGVDDCVVRDLQAETDKAGGNAYDGIRINSADRTKVENVYVNGSDNHGILITGSSTDVEVVGCYVYDPDLNGIIIDAGSVRAKIIHNTVDGSDSHCIYTFANNGHFEGNTVFTAAAINGFYLTGAARRNIVKGNMIGPVGSFGIAVEGRNNMINGNIINDTGGDGIYLASISSDDVVVGNHISAWTGEAIDDDTAGTSTVANNEITPEIVLSLTDAFSLADALSKNI